MKSQVPPESRSENGSKRPLIVLALLLCVLGAFGADAARRFRANASMEHFLPSEGERELYRVSRRVVESTLTQRMILTLSWPRSDDTQATKHIAIAKALATELSATDGISRVSSGPPDGLEEAFFAIYFPRRFSYFSLTPAEDIKNVTSKQALERRTQSLKERLAGPEGVFLRNTAPRDPWLLFPDFLDRLKDEALALDVREGQFMARRPNDSLEHAVLFLELRDSALDAELQGPLLSELSHIIDELHQSHPGKWFVEASGANRFAVRTQASMKADIERVFSLSTVGLVLLFLGLFRSPRRLLFLLLPLGAGLVFATWLSLVIYGGLHALTLAFGSALIGVAIDYPVHILSHHDLEEKGQRAETTVRKLLPTLLLASGTTVVGLLGLAWTAFPGIREIAVFTCSGVVAAVFTATISAGFLATSGGAPPFTRRVAQLLERCLSALRDRRAVLFGVLAAALVLGATGLSQARFAPSLNALAPLDEGLMTEDNRVRDRVGADDGGKLVVALAPSLQQALLINEQVVGVLKDAADKNWIGGYTNVAPLLRSKKLQKEAAELFAKDPELAERTKNALEAEGFVPDAFGDLQAELRSSVAPVTLAMLKKTPLRDLLGTLVFKSGDEFAVISPLRDIRDESALMDAIEQLDNAHYFSQRAVLDQAYGDLRKRTTELLLAGLLLVAVSAWARYRNVRKAAAATLPAIFAASATLGLLSLLGHELNLLHLLGLLLVCSMGVDYGVFLVDAPEKNVGSALLSITVGCLSTMLSFGALSMSQAPALVALGSSIGIGIILALILAPTALLFLRPETR